MLDSAPSVSVMRTSFALRAACTRMSLVAALIVALLMVSPIAWDYPARDLALQRTMVSDSLAATFSQARARVLSAAGVW